MGLTMTELLDKVKSWAVLTSDTLISTQKVYVHRVWVKVGANNDQLAIFDGTGTNGKKFLMMPDIKDKTTQYDIELLFNDGLYFQDISGSAEAIISYTVIAE